MSPPRPRASEPSTSTASLAQTVRRRSVEAFEATTGMPSLMAVDESIMRWLGMVRVRTATLSHQSSAVGAGVKQSSILSSYNSYLAGVDRHNTLLVPEQLVLPEDSLR